MCFAFARKEVTPETYFQRALVASPPLLGAGSLHPHPDCETSGQGGESCAFPSCTDGDRASDVAFPFIVLSEFALNELCVFSCFA